MEILPLTPEQQAVVDASFGKRFAEIQTRSEARLKEELAAAEGKFKEQIAGMETELAELKKKAASGHKDKVDDSAVIARIAAVELKWKQANERAARENLKSIAAELNAINSEQVAVLISAQVKIGDDGNLIVINAEGTPRLNADNKAMTVKELVAEFLGNNPHFVKAGGQPGAGSQGSKGTASGEVKTIKRGEFDKLPPAEQMKFARTTGSQVID